MVHVALHTMHGVHNTYAILSIGFIGFNMPPRQGSNVEIMNAIKPPAPLCPAETFPLLFFLIPLQPRRHETKNLKTTFP